LSDRRKGNQKTRPSKEGVYDWVTFVRMHPHSSPRGKINNKGGTLKEHNKKEKAVIW